MCGEMSDVFSGECAGSLKTIAVTGGIGSGKSVICRMLSAMGYAVYDCDSRAKALMDSSEEIKASIKEQICGDAVKECDGGYVIDRRVLASVVFSDSEKLAMLNSLVHGAVKSDIGRWRQSKDGMAKGGRVFIETAILLESGLDRMVDEVWEVWAPAEVRIARAMARDNVSRDQIESRVANQMLLSEVEGISIAPMIRTVINDDQHPVLPRVLSLLSEQG